MRDPRSPISLQSIADVRAWLARLARNARTVGNDALAWRCIETCRVIRVEQTRAVLHFTAKGFAAGEVHAMKAIAASFTWRPIDAETPKDRPIIGALIRDNRVWRVHDMKHNGLAFYTLNGESLPNMTHWIEMPKEQP